MKLYCTSALQEKLRVKYGPAPAPTDPLDSWYAHVISIQGRSTLLVMLPEIQFCVFVPDFSGDQCHLDTIVVQAIRKALQSCGIPQKAIDDYIPERTGLERCGFVGGSTAARMTATTNQARKLLRTEPDLDQAADRINHIRSVTVGGAVYESPAQALQILLEKREASGPHSFFSTGSAMELAVSLDLGIYNARRTLIVPADITFFALHCYLQAAYGWTFSHLHEFVLPARKGRKVDLHIIDEHTDPMFPDNREIPDRETYLRDHLKEGDSFVYTYDFGDNWDHAIRVRKVLPSYPDKLPVCTLCEGKAPPEDVGGVWGFQDFYRIIHNPKDPEYEEMMEWVEEDWFQPDTAERITHLMQHLPPYLLRNS